ncbi:MAG: hypothetical protein IT559_06365 [Alphaproteobacteria bacterium]|nr:hypothetical protein [Alphaproteobacteria bacterium]
MSMTDELSQISDRPPVGNLTDFVYGVDETNHLDIEVAVNEKGKVVVFHNRPFKKEVTWFEFDLDTNRLDFILDDGDIRDAGLPLSQSVSKYMQNSHQILMVLLDQHTGEAKEGNYVPLIIHRKE